MLLLRLWNYIRGYVIIFVEGYFLEKFINICTHRQIFLWDLKRVKNCEMSMKVSIRGFRMLRAVARKSKCRVRIVLKRGLPFLFNRYKRRKAFIAGAVFFIAILYALSSFIWAVEVSGNKSLDSGFILEKLSEIGVRPGVLKYGIDTDRTVNTMMLDIRELSWISVTVRGTKVKVQLAERRKPPELLDRNEPCNIVASKDGVIKSIIVKSGLEAVNVGDTVKKGQLLISGELKIKNEEGKARLVHSLGTVTARTWYEEECPVRTVYPEKIRTGRIHDLYSVVLFTRRINLFHSEVKFDNYDKIEIKKSIAFGEDFVLPFEFIIDRHYENTTVERTLEPEEGKKMAADNALKAVSERIPEGAERVKTYLNYITKEDSSLAARVTVECIEEIGITEKIGGN